VEKPALSVFQWAGQPHKTHARGGFWTPSNTWFLKPSLHQKQCRSNIRLRSIRQFSFDIVAGVDGF